MRAIFNLFGSSPFVLLQSHMDHVNDCIQKVPEFFETLLAGDIDRVEQLAAETSKLEHIADLSKQEIRNQLSMSMFLPTDKMVILEILTLQDALADKAEDIGILVTLKKMTIPKQFRDTFQHFLQKNLEAFEGAKIVIQELPQLINSSFGGNEAKKVQNIIDDVAYKEHEVDKLQRELLKKLFSIGEELSTPIFHLWLSIFKEVSDISNLSEKLAYRVRAMLDITK